MKQIITSKFKMFQGIRNDRETSGVTGERDLSSFLIPCTVMPTACLPTISCVTVSLVYLFMTAL